MVLLIKLRYMWVDEKVFKLYYSKLLGLPESLFMEDACSVLPSISMRQWLHMIISHGHEQQRWGECSWRVKDGQRLRSARAGETKVICNTLLGSVYVCVDDGWFKQPQLAQVRLFGEAAHLFSTRKSLSTSPPLLPCYAGAEEKPPLGGGRHLGDLIFAIC